MHYFWDTIISPILLHCNPEHIVEIGSDLGITTRLLLEHCIKHNAILHSIDPDPKYDVTTWQQEYGNRFMVYCSKSLDALPLITQPDVVLVDGDHNWYTVFSELSLLERLSGKAVRPFPIVLLHDVEWPYGRRDLYYYPENIPDEYRHQYQQMGIVQGVSELQAEGGINSDLIHACHEGGPRNGVLTAVEDFLLTTVLPLQFVIVPGFFGLGILCLPEITREGWFNQFMQVHNLRPYEFGQVK